MAPVEAQMLASAVSVRGQWRFERLEGAGHWIPLDAPGVLNALLLGLLVSRSAWISPFRKESRLQNRSFCYGLAALAQGGAMLSMQVAVVRACAMFIAVAAMLALAWGTTVTP
ncbi:MAG: hypothetical protein ACOYN3_02455 [Acidimicrobiia bacterium]